MGIASAPDILQDWHASLAALSWQVEMGLVDVLGEEPVNAYDLPDGAARPAMPVAAAPRVEEAAPVNAPPADPLALARAAADGAHSLAALHEALRAYDHCDLKKGARNTVFADGNPAARVLILGEAPGRDEDHEGRPFVGKAGQLLDRMFAAIHLSRSEPAPEAALYITNVMPWRPPGNRDPEPAEIAMMLPFVHRHIALVNPQVIVTMGNTPLQALTGNRGILRARGRWGEVLGRPHLPMLHPAYLLRTPEAKREAWADLLSLQDWLRRHPRG